MQLCLCGYAGATHTCANNRVPVLQRCGPPADVPLSRRAVEKRARDEKGEEEGSVGTATGRKRALGLEQSQGHPECAQTAEERDGERRTRGEDDNGIAAKRARLISGRRRGCLSLQCPSACLSAFSFSSFHQLKVVDGLLCLSSYRRPPDTSNSLAALFPFPLLAPALILSLAFSILFDLCLLPSHGPNKHNCWAFSVLLSLCAQSKGRLQTSKQPLFKLESLKLVLESLFLSAKHGCLFSSILSFKSYQSGGCLCSRRKKLC